MKKWLLLFLSIYSLTISAIAQSDQRSAQQSLSLFSGNFEPISDDKVKTGVIIELRKKVLEEIVAAQPNDMKITLPSADGQGKWVLELKKNDVLSDDLLVTTSDGSVLSLQNIQSKAVHYRGRIEGISPSLVAMSFFEGSLMGVISNGESNFDLGMLENDPSGRYVLYDANHLYKELPFNCSPIEHNDPDPSTNYRVGGLNCSRGAFKVYYECDYQMFLDRGSNTTNVVNYVTGLHNVVNVLYNNEGLNSTISQIFVWTSADPYRTLTSSSTYLTNFRSNRTSFNGNLAHLLSTRPTNLGGIAYLDVICSTPNRYAFSNISNSYNQFPTYSWSVMVVTHEIGHNLGSPHTQSCSWPGGAIDNCYPVEGTCSQGPAPVNGGTIMSYCHLTANGINFNNGFGPLPGGLIRNRTLNSPCLDLTAGSGTIALGCIPTTTNPFNNTGIGPLQVQLRNIDFASPSANNGVFSDYSCTVGDTLTEGQSYTLRVLTSGSNRQNVRAWIDYNSDNVFASGEQVLSSNGASTGNVWHQASVVIPTTALKNTPLRMRVISEFSATTNPQPCGTLPYGQAEDYALFIVGSNAIQTSSLPVSSICSGTAISVPFTATGTFNAGNVFTAQLSDASGSFAFPVNIGTLSGTASGTISATIPIGMNTGSGYRIRVVSNNPSITGSQSATALSITQSVTPTVNIAINGGTSSICAGTSATFTATPTNGGASPTFQWRINGSNVGTNSPTFTTNALTNGQIVSCVMTSNAACASPAVASSNSISITVNSLPVAAITGNNAICSGEATSLTAIGGSSVLWNTGASTLSIVVSPSATTTYSATITNAAGCSSSASRTVNVTNTVTPVFNAIPALCEGETAPVLSTISNNGITGTWSPSVVSNINSGTYVFTPNAGQCANTGSSSVTVNPKPDLNISGNTFICPGQSTTLAVSGADSYSWNTGASTASIVVSPAATTTYVATGTLSTGCTANAEATVTVSSDAGAVPATPVAIIGSTTICDGSTGVAYSIAPLQNAVSYNWQVSNGTIVSGQGTDNISINFPSLYTSLTISVQGINACGVAGSFSTITVKAPAKSSIPGVVSGNFKICNSSTDVPYSILPVANAVAYNWTITQGVITTPVNGTSVSVNFPSTYTSSTLSVQSINVCGIASTPRTATITNPVATTPGLITGNTTVCAGASGQTYSIAPVVGAVSYYWETSAGSFTTPVNGTSVNLNFPASYTSLTVKVQSINVCGQRSAFRSLTVKPPVAASVPVTILGSTSVCPGSTGVTYSMQTVSNAVSYQWEITGGTISGPNNGTSVQVNFPSPYTSVTLSVRSVNSCGTLSAARTLKIVPPAVIRPGVISGPQNEVCNGSTGLIYSVAPVAGAVGYNWVASNGTIQQGQGTNSIVLDAPSNYTSFTLKVQSINACGTISTLNTGIAVRSIPLTPASITGSASVCPGAITEFSASTTIGADAYSWIVPSGWTILSGQGTQAISVLVGSTGGSLSVAATNDCGTSIRRSKVISIISCLDEENPGALLPTDNGRNIELFPNPAKSELSVKADGIQRVDLIDIQGRILLSSYFQNSNQASINLQQPSGIYMVRIQGDGWSEIRKLVIQQ
jgi:hypothetical protein